jgi:hypothetical protein
VEFHFIWDVMLIVFQRSNMNKLTNYRHYLSNFKELYLPIDET